MVSQKNLSAIEDNEDDENHDQFLNYYKLTILEQKFVETFIIYGIIEIRSSMMEYSNERASLQLVWDIIENEEEYNEYCSDFSQDYNVISVPQDFDNENSDVQESFGEENNQESYDFFGTFSLFEYSTNFLNHYCPLLGFKDSEIGEIQQLFALWMIRPFSEIVNTNHKQLSSIDVWKVLSYYKSWRNLSELALRFFVLSSSEAAAERFFPLQRFSVSKHRYRTKKSDCSIINNYYV